MLESVDPLVAQSELIQIGNVPQEQIGIECEVPNQRIADPSEDLPGILVAQRAARGSRLSGGSVLDVS